MKKVLIIAYNFPPSNSVSIHRILRFGKWLPEFGWEPLVLTAKYRLENLTRKDEETIQFKNKYFKHVYVVGYFTCRLFRLASRINIRYVNFLIRTFFWNLLPDRNIYWLYPAVAEGRKIIEDHKIDAIWATVPPLTAGIIGSRLSKLTGVPLLLDYRDPLSSNPSLKHTKIKNGIIERIERKMLRQANAVCVSSVPMKTFFIGKNIVNKQHISVVKNGFDKEMQNVLDNNEQTSINKDFLNITYIGNFMGDRQPFTFIDGIKLYMEKKYNSYGRLRVHFVGNNCYKKIEKYVEKLQLRDIFSFHGEVSYKKAMKYSLDSDILLLINGLSDENQIFIPGKLFDYLAVEKPILFIGKGQPQEILKELNIGETATHHIDDIANKLSLIIGNYNRYNINQTKASIYDAKHSTNDLARILNIMAQ